MKLRLYKYLSFLIALTLCISATLYAQSQPKDAAKPSEQSKPLRISTVLTRMVVFLYEDSQPYEDAKVQGTGFIIGIPVPDLPNTFIPLIVTAKHVIANRNTIAVRYSPASGEKPVYKSYSVGELRKSNDFFEHTDKGVDIVAFRTLSFDDEPVEKVLKA